MTFNDSAFETEWSVIKLIINYYTTIYDQYDIGDPDLSMTLICETAFNKIKKSKHTENKCLLFDIDLDS